MGISRYLNYCIVVFFSAENVCSIQKLDNCLLAQEYSNENLKKKVSLYFTILIDWLCYQVWRKNNKPVYNLTDYLWDRLSNHIFCRQIIERCPVLFRLGLKLQSNNLNGPNLRWNPVCIRLFFGRRMFL